MSVRADDGRWRTRVGALERLLDRHGRAVALVCAAVAVASTSGLALALGSELRYEDEREYVVLADNLADLGRYTLDGVNATAFRPPVYPLLLGALRWTGIGTVGLRLVNAAIAGVVVLLVFAIGRRIASTSAGALGAIIVAVYPLLVYTSATLYPQALATALMLAALALALALGGGNQERPWLTTVGLGICLGVLTLTVPSFAPLLVVVPAWLFWRRRKGVMPLVAVVLVGAAVPIGLWTVRNLAALDAAVPLATNGGFNLLLGNSPDATASSGTQVDLSAYADEARSRGLDEVETDRYFRTQAIDWMADHPVRATRLYLGKLLNTFALTNEMATEVDAEAAQRWVLAVTYLPVLALFVARLALVRRWQLHIGEGLLIAAFISVVLFGALFFTRLRFRAPVDTIMIVVVATFLVDLARRWTSPRVR